MLEMIGIIKRFERISHQRTLPRFCADDPVCKRILKLIEAFGACRSHILTNEILVSLFLCKRITHFARSSKKTLPTPVQRFALDNLTMSYYWQWNHALDNNNANNAF